MRGYYWRAARSPWAASVSVSTTARLQCLLCGLVLQETNAALEIGGDPLHITRLDPYAAGLAGADGDRLQNAPQVGGSPHAVNERVVWLAHLPQDLTHACAAAQQFDDALMLVGALLCAGATLPGGMLQLCLRYAAFVALPFARDSRKVTTAAALRTPSFAALMSTSRCLV